MQYGKGEFPSEGEELVKEGNASSTLPSSCIKDTGLDR